MPELPEVETIKLGLQKYLVGHRIESVDVRLKKLVSGDVDQIIGAKIIDIKRFGKGLVFELDNGYVMAIHIKMTGQLIYSGADSQKIFHPSQKVGGELPNKFTHVIFHLDKKTFLFYNDIRQFGWIKILKNENLKQLPFFKDLGPEPLKDLTLEQFEKIVGAAKGPIKPLLMDQKKISGIGNIYANEALFEAKIDPRRKANSLTETETKKLFSAIEFVLEKSLSMGGASETNFVNALGEDGSYQKHFLVYGQKGKSCPVCGTKIEMIRQAGRGTFFCPKCQK
ncbi:MAG TPA: bifunctional DNA-formamidopyrimidine glycosylase/DNA-(apurinic or apyrimidinic site) lyase [Patescibacteria group bacterium]|nr:bifunctional DNA-formamidopyrimidine glycosylase/DNA-(apurinic or apyrimidinic site) lyase [Patescibacteria group bacterium]